MLQTSIYWQVFVGCVMREHCFEAFKFIDRYLGSGDDIMAKIKICVFSDYHYSEAHPWGQNGLDEIIERAHSANVDVIMHCGDFSVNAGDNKGFIDKFVNNKYNIPVVFCYGNHELQEIDSLEELNRAYGIENSYYFKEINGFRFIVLDANWWRDDDGSLHRYPGRSVGSPKGWDYDHNIISAEQFEWFKETMETSKLPCIILSHTPIWKSVRAEHIAIMQAIDEVNDRNPGRVMMYFNGHLHRNNIALINRVVHFNVNSTYDGEWQPKKHDLFPKEYLEKYPSMSQCSIFNDPLSAIVEIEDNGHIKINGMETSYVYGVSPEMYGGPFRSAYGIAEPRISSAEFFLRYGKENEL